MYTNGLAYRGTRPEAAGARDQNKTMRGAELRREQSGNK